MAYQKIKLALFAVVGLFAAGSALALPISFEPEAAFESNSFDAAALSTGTGTSGEEPGMEFALQGMSFMSEEFVIVYMSFPIAPASDCNAAATCEATAVPEPGTWLLFAAGLLGLGLTQRKNG